MAGLVAVVTAGLAVTGVAHLGALLSGGPALPGNPFDLIPGLLFGDVPWPARTLLAAGLVGGLLLVLAVVVVVVWRRARRGRKRGDEKARLLGTGAQLASLTSKPVAVAARLGIDGAPGLPIAVSVAGRRELWQDWEAVCLQLWPPRTGKTSSQSIRRVLAAPGAVLATTNKGGRNEIVAATRGAREAAGQVFVYDPQGIAGEKPGRVWWNPLARVTDVVTARGLAKVFADSQRAPGAKTDAYFDPEGLNLLANFLLAAAVARAPITTVLGWLDEPNNTEPARILTRGGFEAQARSVTAIINLGLKGDAEQRGGVYRTAANSMTWLGSAAAQAWCTPPTRAGAVEFVPAGFVRSTDTLYLLSREGEGSTAPLITALAVAVCEEALAYARSRPEGRLPVPLVVELDEAANICRWADLPDLYSHFGSQGIPVTTYLQSWAQGEAVWGREGMRKLWGASNVAVIGPGIRDAGMLRDLSELAGDHDVARVSVSRSRGGQTVSRSLERRRILPVSALNSLPDGRVLVLASGAPPVLARTVPWWETDQKAAVEASQARYAPTGDQPRPLEVDDVVAALADVPPAGAGNPWAGRSWS
jgi:type IV secretory pathway TraG/TraD family ATPase VirD4